MKQNIGPGAIIAIIAVVVVIVGFVAYRMFFTDPYASPLEGKEKMKEFEDAQKRSAIHENMKGGGGGRGAYRSGGATQP